MPLTPVSARRDGLRPPPAQALPAPWESPSYPASSRLGGVRLRRFGSLATLGRAARYMTQRTGACLCACPRGNCRGLEPSVCGGRVNYQMPWNPMRAEQRIGRIDRIGQEHSVVRVNNLFSTPLDSPEGFARPMTPHPG